MISKFTDIGIPEDVAKAMDDMGWDAPTPHLPVAKAGAAHRAANGMGPAAEAVMGIPELIRLTPAGFLQRIRRQHQHLAGEVLLAVG